MDFRYVVMTLMMHFPVTPPISAGNEAFTVLLVSGTFALQVTPESVELHYYSNRPGLWPIVVSVWTCVTFCHDILAVAMACSLLSAVCHSMQLLQMERIT